MKSGKIGFQWVSVIALLSIAATLMTSMGVAVFFNPLPQSPFFVRRMIGAFEIPGDLFFRFWTCRDSVFYTGVYAHAFSNQSDRKEFSVQALEDAAKWLPAWSIVLQPWNNLPSPNDQGYPEIIYVEMAFGFPFRCLQLRIRGTANVNGPAHTPVTLESSGRAMFMAEGSLLAMDEHLELGVQYNDAISKSGDTYSTLANCVLPTHVLWPGMVANVLVYAAGFTGIWFLWSFHRTHRLRGRCSNCGYPRAGLVANAACPECGLK